MARQVILFGLGVVFLVYELVTPDVRVAIEITGLVLVGLVPVDVLLSAYASKRAGQTP